MIARARSPAPWLLRAFGGAAFLIPFMVALVHLGNGTGWRGDLPLLRGLAWVPAGPSGGLWPLLIQASFFVPLGSLPLRAGFFAALVLGSCGFAIFWTTRNILVGNADTPRLSTALATIAALTTTLGATAQREGTAIGGASVGLLVAIALIGQRPAESLTHPGRGVAVGMLFGALAAESPPSALAVLFAVGAGFLVTRVRPSRGTWMAACGAVIATSLLVTAPMYLRPFAPGAFLDMRRGLSALGAAPFERPAAPLGGLGIFKAEIGLVALVLAVLGAAVGVSRQRLRSLTVPLVALVGFDLLASLQEGHILSVEALAPVHWLALGALSIGVAIAVHTIASTLLALGLSMARGATVLLVMTDLTIAATAAEDAAFVADRSVYHGSEALTDEAFLRLPPNAAVLPRSPAILLRLWSARLTEGARPDVLIIPLPILGDPRLALGLLEHEPAIQQTLRDVALEGRPGEEALTILADARPVLAELDPKWDRRVVSHFVADHLWLRFAPQPLGPSDRKAAFADLRSRFDRVLTASTVLDHPDESSLAVLRARMTDATAEAAMLGDREEAISLLERLAQVSSGDRFVSELTQRLAASKSGAIDTKGLLH